MGGAYKIFAGIPVALLLASTASAQAVGDKEPSATVSAVGTSGSSGPVFYWVDDEDDFAKFLGQRVEIVGELSDTLKKGEVEVESK